MKKSSFIGKFIFLTLLIQSLAMPSFAEDNISKDAKWWDKAVFYQMWPRSFADNDGDGNGDFKGMTAKLDYLNDGDEKTKTDLGINAIWLTPMLEAPSYHGYDFFDFYNVEKDYGTMQDFKTFLKEANKRDIKVIMDLVVNHISNQSEWFQKSAQKIEPYKDFFVWSKERPKGWGKPWSVPGQDGFKQPEQVWIWNEVRKEYYYAAFDGSQPDLNFKNPKVREEVKKIAKFWLDKGMSGFRLDAVRYIDESGGWSDTDNKSMQADTAGTLEWWKEFSAYVKSIKPDAFLVGEAWSDIGTISKYYSNGKGLDRCFDFEFGYMIIDSLNNNSDLSKSFKEEYERKTKGSAPVDFYSPFLTNHDQTRLMYQFNGDENKAKMAAALLFTHVGTPFIYYGEEIGMSQNQEGDDTFRRAIMQWDSSNNLGFNKTDKIWLDEHKWVSWINNFKPWWKDYADNLDTNSTVEAQKNDETSLLTAYKKLIEINQNNPEFRTNNLEFIDSKIKNVLIYSREAEKNKSIVIFNNSNKTQKIKVDALEGAEVKDLMTNTKLTFKDGTVSLTKKSFVILKINQ